MMGRKWNEIIRIAAVVMAALIWWLGMNFSVDGFGFKLPHYKAWGYILSLAVTVLEFVYVEEGLNHDIALTLMGWGAYGYDILTNFMGIMIGQGSPDFSTGDITTLAFDVVLAVSIGLAPELLLKWGLGIKGRDFVSKMRDQFQEKSNGGESRQAQAQGQNKPEERPGADLRYNPKIQFSNKHNGQHK